MAFNANIPQPTDQQSDSQSQLLANFQAIKTLIDINHATFGSANEGKHLWVSMPEQSAAPSTAANEMAIYTKEVSEASGTKSQLFLRNENNGDEVNWTSATKSNSNGTLTLPSGVILKWGRATSNGSGISSVTFTTAFPNDILTAYATIAVVGGNSSNNTAYDRLVRVYNYTKSTLEAVTYINQTNRARTSETFTWFAIGY